MDASSRLTSKGQLTVPKPVREALGLEPGDELHFRVEGGRATLSKTPDFIALAGTVEVPAAKRGTSWDQVLGKTRAVRAKSRH
jgi:antitoxin PrlF